MASTPAPLIVQKASSTNPNPAAAVAELRAQISITSPALTIVYCDSSYDHAGLAAALTAAFPAPIIGCTAMGQINPEGFSKALVSIACLSGPLTATPHTIRTDHIEEDVLAIAAQYPQSTTSKLHNFGFLLIDGLTRTEEATSSSINQHLPRIPFAGGSASDKMEFKKTQVLSEGVFKEKVAVFTVVTTDLPFTLIKFEHYRPSEVQLVVTKADPEKRQINELNGEPAATVYSREIGTPIKDLNNNIFSSHPLMLGLGQEQYIRGTGQALEDGSLQLFCAIEEGVVLSIGKVIDPITTLKDAFAHIEHKVGSIAFVFGCDCAHRRMDFDNAKITKEAGDLYAHYHVFGFSTFGEQYNGIHINQTFTGIALGQSK